MVANHTRVSAQVNSKAGKFINLFVEHEGKKYILINRLDILIDQSIVMEDRQLFLTVKVSFGTDIGGIYRFDVEGEVGLGKEKQTKAFKLKHARNHYLVDYFTKVEIYYKWGYFYTME
ncbi:9958_t:CDS:2, partial [Funneliformis geosporum]